MLVQSVSQSFVYLSSEDVSLRSTFRRILCTSGSSAPSSGLPTPSRRRNVGICFSLVDTELKKSSFDTMGEDVVGKTSLRRAKH